MRELFYNFFWLRDFLRAFRGCERGSILPFVALTFPVLIGMIGLGTDASLWMSEKRILQSAADSSVIAAGWEVAQETEEYMGSAALREAEKNGYQPSKNGELLVEILETTTEGTRLGVTVTQDADTFFSGIIFSDPIRISAYAEALVGGNDGAFCILSLDETSPNAMTTFGSATVNMPNCGIAVNSNHENSLSIGGNAEVTIHDVRTVGGYDTGNSSVFEYDSLLEGVAPTEDPYKDLEVPSYSGCDNNKTKLSSSTTLSPGVYCNGLSVSGDVDIHFDPGVYILDGGSFKVTGGGSLYGEGVTFILTGSGNDYAQMDISGSKEIDLKPPLSGEEWSGITFFQDPNAPSGNNYQNKITGTSDIIIDGVLYFPSQGLWFGGNTNVLGEDSPCTKLIAKTVTLAGNPRLGSNCTPYDVEEFGPPSVRLVY